ncbi:FkbM family methyltransferase [Mucilaginibacter sp. JRF]|uniref:FkbM family methyltransferase n=1 Tax=Mucilaginibacter sp. JRF TaxID=2780088 RepID=UPI00187FDCC7|nr:FkbM family methyltransferase [Mucilaginibacter sp. JRF]MBE9586617.1 FkbM family methyltransferase [Mucilaginibacter sp. JRF]
MLVELDHRTNTDDDQWVIPEIMHMDMYHVKDQLAALEPDTASYVIDCGAHIGAFSAMCAMYLKNAEIISFEPNPDSFKYLDANAAKFKNIQAYNKAVGVTSGQMEIYAPDQSEWSGRWTSLPNANTSITVDVVGLFDFIHALNKPVFVLKMDIEGYEELIFNDAEQHDFKNIQVIIVETHTPAFDHQKLLDYGYQLLFNPEISSARQFVYSKPRIPLIA